MADHTNIDGFTLLELVIAVAIMGIIAMIGIPQYQGYRDAAQVTLVQNNLRNIYLMERDYFTTNGEFYATGATCTQSAAAINTNLFGGEQVLTTEDGYNYCILQDTTDDFTATADEIDGARTFTLDETNTANF